ncbi:MAG: hypothetical protein AAB520_02500 [Patescibacteria group bacterium]
MKKILQMSNTTNRKIFKYWYLLVVLVFIGSILAQSARAQETSRTFTISPPTVQAELDPGQQTQGTLKIINDGDSPLVFQTSTQDFIVKDDDGTPYILPPDTLSNKYSGASWIAIYPDVITIEPHKKVEVNYYIQVPSDARPGGHYGAVMYNPTNVMSVSGTGASVNTSVGTLFYLTVKGPVSIKAMVSKFTTQGIWDFGPVKINTSILNSSDVHIKPLGTITVTNMLGQKSDVKKINEFNIFPGVSRNYETKLGKKFMLGFYRGNLNATYGPDKLPLIATTSFIVFPWKIAIFIILLALVVGFGYRYWKNPSRHEPNPPEQTQY